MIRSQRRVAGLVITRYQFTDEEIIADWHAYHRRRLRERASMVLIIAICVLIAFNHEAETRGSSHEGREAITP